jgi:hypothetical protein
MVRNISFCTLASVAVLLLSSDANAFWRNRGCSCGGYGNGYGYYGGSSCCGATTSCGCGGGAAYSAAYGATATMPAAPTGADTSGTVANPPVAQPGTVQPGVDAYGRPYNPGGIGGPASGIGVRPGLGAGGLGPRR